MMQVVRMQNFRNISPMSDLAWSGVGCPPLFLLLSVRKRNSRQPKTGALPAGRGSIIIISRRHGETVVFSAIRACPGICVCDSSAGTDSTRCTSWWIDEPFVPFIGNGPLTMELLTSDQGPRAMYHVPCMQSPQITAVTIELPAPSTAHRLSHLPHVGNECAHAVAADRQKEKADWLLGGVPNMSAWCLFCVCVVDAAGKRQASA